MGQIHALYMMIQYNKLTMEDVCLLAILRMCNNGMWAVADWIKNCVYVSIRRFMRHCLNQNTMYNVSYY